MPVNSSVVNNNQTTSQTWHGNGIYQTDTFMGPPAPNQPPSNPTSSSMTIGQVNYNLLDFNQRTHAEYQFSGLKHSGAVSGTSYNFFTQNNSSWLLGGGTGSGSGIKLPANNNYLNPFPIGAFYDSQSAAFDNAASIARSTARAMNASGQALSAAQLAALDANGDGQISTAEAAGLRLWADVNEDGRIDSGELLGVEQAILQRQWAQLTQGNGPANDSQWQRTA